MYDENNYNEIWLAYALENHDQALAEYNWGLAAAIEKDVANAGFSVEAKRLATFRQQKYHNDPFLGEEDESDVLREHVAFQ